MTIRPAKRSFAAGEVDPDIAPRSDLVANQNGLERCRNFLIRPQGGATRRSGTEFVANAKFADRKARLGPFRRAADDALIVEWGDSYARFVAAGAQVISGGVPLEIATIYGVADLPDLQWAQSGDVVWIFSSQRFKELQRTAAAPPAFQLVDAQVKNGPFLDPNTDDSLTIGASASTGAGITLTASAAIFDPGHVGAFWRLDEIDYSDTPKWEAGFAYTAGAIARYDGNVYMAANSATSTGNPPSHLEGDQADGSAAGALIWTYLHSGYGIVQITGYTSTTQVTADVIRRLPGQALGAGTYKWREGAWSDYRGWPKVGALWQRRLWGGNTAHLPFYLWASAIQGFDDFEDGTLDDQAIARGLFDGETDALRWMAPGWVMAIGTGGPEWVATSADKGKGITPSTLDTRASTNDGSCKVPAVRVGNRTLFVDKTARSLREWDFSFANDRYETTDLSLLAAHILGPAVVEMAWQQTGRVLWCLLRDGKVAGFTYQPDQEIFAWHLHDFGDPVESIAVVPAEGGERDDLYLIVNRPIAGVDARVIERLRPPFNAPAGDTVDAAWYLDSAIEATGVGLTVIAGLDHLEGHQVIANCDGKEHRALTVAGGQITLDYPADRVIVGLDFTSTLKTLPFDMGLRDEFQRGRNKTLTSLALTVRDAIGGVVRVNGRKEAIDRFGQSDLDSAPSLRSGLRHVTPPGGTADTVQMEVEYRGCYPATVTSILPEYEV